MRFLTIVASALAFAATGLASINSTQEFYLVSKLVGESANKSEFAGLYVDAYHSGAGTNDAVLLKGKANGAKAYLNKNGTTSHTAAGETAYPLIFDLDQTYAWSTQISNVDFYAEWLPAQINVADASGPNAYFINGTGLQGVPNAGFGGWLVCQWYRGVPQLFELVRGQNFVEPSSCARIQLVPEYA